MIWNRLIMNDEIINKKYTFWENIIINIHCFEDFVRCGLYPYDSPDIFFYISLYVYPLHCYKIANTSILQSLIFPIYEGCP